MMGQIALENVYAGNLWSYAQLILISTLILIVILYILYMISGYLKIARLCLTLPGPPALPIIGNTMLATDTKLLQRYGTQLYLDYGPLVRVWLALLPVVVVLSPPHVQAILSSAKHTDKTYFYKLLHNFIGEGLITSSGSVWRSHRKLIQPSFHLGILEKYVQTFSDSANDLVKKLEKAPGEINITPFVNNCIMDILNEAVLGVPIVSAENGEICEASPFRRGKVVAPYRISRPWLLFNWIYKLTDAASSEMEQKKSLNDFTKRMIDRRRADKASGVKRERKSLLEYMIDVSDTHPDFTEEDIINEACTFMLAGQDSVGAAVAFCLFLLAKHQDHQEKVYAEITQVFSTSTNPSQSPTISQLRELRYLEQCVKETLRLYPSVPMFARRISEPIQLDSHTLPAGCEVFIAPYATHRLAEYYPDPEKFDPDRFLPEVAESRHPYAYIPFSAGPRNCIGYKFAIMEMKTVISRVLRSFHLSTVKGKEEPDVRFRITVRASGGLWLKLTARNRGEI